MKNKLPIRQTNKTMPIRFCKKNTTEELALICKNDWDLTTQIDFLAKLIDTTSLNLLPNNYVADIGFDIQLDSVGGSLVPDSKTMKLLADKGFSEYLPVYPNQLKDN